MSEEYVEIHNALLGTTFKTSKFTWERYVRSGGWDWAYSASIEATRQKLGMPPFTNWAARQYIR